MPLHRLNQLISLNLTWTLNLHEWTTSYQPASGSVAPSTRRPEPKWVNAWQLLAGLKVLKVLHVELISWDARDSALDDILPQGLVRGERAAADDVFEAAGGL